MENQHPPRQVAELTGARMPADHGLAGLGLIMQLVGSTMAGIMALLSMTPLLQRGGGAPLAWPLFLLGSSGLIRAVYHRIAGSSLLYGSPKGSLAGVRTYVVAATVTTLVWLYVFKSQLQVPGKAVFGIGVLLMAWPIALAGVLAWPRIKRFAGENLPMAEDLGFEGAAVLMLLLGVTGALVTGLMLIMIVKVGGGEVLSSGSGLMMLATLALLVVRSCLHAMAGYKGTRGLDSDGATDAATRYFNFGVSSSVIVGGVLLVQMMMTSLHPIGLLMAALMVYFLLVWPLLLRRFFSERNFASMLSGNEGPSYRRAPDAGLTALGWLLFALGVYGLAAALPGAVLGNAATADMMSMLGNGGVDPAALAEATRSPWWAVGLAAIQLWAAFELVTMSDRHKLAGTIYGAVAAAATLWLYWPTFKSVGSLMGQGNPLAGMDGIFGFMMVAIQLVIPVGTIALVNRQHTPEARAQFRAPA